MKARSFLAALIAAFAGASPAVGAGRMDGQERGDVVFRDIPATLHLGSHGGIFDAFVDTNTSGRTPDEKAAKAFLIEMTGITTLDSGSIVTGVVGISTRSLAEFQEDGTYHGAFAKCPSELSSEACPDGAQLPSRGRRLDDAGSRMAILKMARRLKGRLNPIQYIIRENDASINVATRYLTAEDGVVIDPGSVPVGHKAPDGTVPANGKIDIYEIFAMRSDAFVEYCYAAAGFPILIIDPGTIDAVTKDVTDPVDLIFLQNRVKTFGALLPSHQEASMIPAFVDLPNPTLFFPPPDSSDPQALELQRPLGIEVKDKFSGPGRLELFRINNLGAPEFGVADSGIPALSVDGEALYSADSTSHFYDLSRTSAAFNILADGRYVIRALDQAGNERSGNFKIDTPPLLNLRDQFGNALYSDFQGPSMVSVAPPRIIQTPLGFLSQVTARLSTGNFSNATIAEFSLKGPSTNIVVSNPPTETDLSYSIVPHNNHPTLAEVKKSTGPLIARAITSLGAATTAPFSVESLWARVCPEAYSTYDNAFGFGANRLGCFTASLGLGKLEELSGPPDAGRLLSATDLAGNELEYSWGGIFTDNLNTGISPEFQIRDLEGHVYSFHRPVLTAQLFYPAPAIVPGATGYTSAVMDLRDTGEEGAGFLPGARAGLLLQENEAGNAYRKDSVAQLIVDFVEKVGDVAIGTATPFANVKVSVLTASTPTLSGAMPTVLLDKNLAGEDRGLEATASAGLDRYFSWTVALTTIAPEAVPLAACHDFVPGSTMTRCSRWAEPAPRLVDLPLSVVGQHAGLLASLEVPIPRSDEPQTFSLGLGLKIGFTRVTTQGALRVSLSNRRAEPGKITLEFVK